MFTFSLLYIKAVDRAINLKGTSMSACVLNDIGISALMAKMANFLNHTMSNIPNSMSVTAAELNQYTHCTIKLNELIELNSYHKIPINC